MSRADLARLVAIAWCLDRCRWIPSPVLRALVADLGACMTQCAEPEPAWLDQAGTDRELAARMCAGCPVADQCLELELRTGGPESIGVWGGLAEADRRAVRPYWLQRGDRVDKPSDLDGGQR